MLFDDEEKISLIAALESFEDSCISASDITSRKLVKTTLQKLENLSAITHFTNSEFRIMGAALQYIAKLLNTLNEPIHADMLDLLQRLYDLSFPSED